MNLSMKIIVNSILFLLLSVTCLPVLGQTYFGISATLGNRLSFSPPSIGLRRPLSLSGNITVRVQEKTRNNWIAQYGADFGVLGYNLKTVYIDTIRTDTMPPDFELEYSTVYGNLHLLVGKVFIIGEQELLAGVGGGITRYYSFFETVNNSSSFKFPDSPTEYKLFSSSMNGPVNKTSAYMKVAVQLRLSKFISIGLEYSNHFKPVINGIYEFYHTKTPTTGKIALYQKEFSVVFLVNISKTPK